MTLNIVPLASMGAAYADFVFCNVSASASNSDVPFGVQDGTRRIAAFVSGAGITAVTIGGVVATHLLTATNVTNVGQLYIARVPNGVSGAVSITGSDSVYKLAMYSIYESGSNTPNDTAIGSGSSGSSVSIDAPASGLIIACRFSAAGSGSTWTGLDEDADQVSGSTGAVSSAHREFTSAVTNHSVSVSGGSLTFEVILAASFGL
jgi:hypothetical protein